MLAVLQFVAVLASLLFTGAAIYINLVEHPARMSCSTRLAATEWVPSYKRATLMQAPLAIIGFVCGTGAWWLGAGTPWLVAAVGILLVVPFTLIIMEPRINKPLLAPGRDLSSPETRELLVRWGRFHAVRSTLGLIASAIYLWHLVGA
jgi:hypothetical protein